VIRAGYELLHLITFFTVGPKEARAWTVYQGATAPNAAGEIHSDFEKGFIRAETIAFDDFVTLGGEAKAREAGKLRAEGKGYVVQDGDVMHFCIVSYSIFRSCRAQSRHVAQAVLDCARTERDVGSKHHEPAHPPKKPTTPMNASAARNRSSSWCRVSMT